MSFYYRLPAALITATIASVQPAEFAVAQLSAQQAEEIDRNECNPLGPIDFNIDFNEAIRLNPNDAEAYHCRGVVHYQQGDLKRAIADFNEAIRLAPNYAKAYSNRGAVRLLQGDIEGAMADYNEAIRLEPKDADAYFTRAKARNEQRDIQGAINDFQKASELYQQQGNTDSYRNAQNAIRELQKELEVKLFIIGTHRSITNYRAYLI
ncbi:tetratricopeptide repeat protein [Microcoleus sp. MON1_C5]|uniref:tetratricopeptide repeat protein n=1 Tax=Microcoleus sp. MON1_C5 TaxID=2818828 RepID=UPI002FD470F9